MFAKPWSGWRQFLDSGRWRDPRFAVRGKVT
jgi:hypothetical protein